MRYAIEQYDKHGFLKAPKCLLLGWLFMAKAWVVFVVAGLSRSTGNTIINIIYPDYSMLYLGLAMGLPSVVLMWMISMRSPERKWLVRIFSWGKWITLSIAAAQLSQTLYHVYLHHGAFSWPNALTLLLILWFMMYIYTSRSVRDCFNSTSLS
ncbi:DUF2919 domain-containing protein [Vibrio ostreicida]|uniref:DUF2919 domain-containing protein n=1 Tax=Vibrio ostreicida TaxID=526588 RepID=A0ABT8BU40_9VIBR|nr:DUF2919 domain-containing protein [Vibrio ostreicida]MDN3610682.1 DUF2919 domain-containing protein [Vibrio ostreicida]NPD07320.1 DUF2919 domain-containing protein [Vibrio ostreicida]